MICYSLAQFVTQKQGKNKFIGYLVVGGQQSAVSYQVSIGEVGKPHQRKNTDSSHQQAITINLIFIDLYVKIEAKQY